MAAVTLRSGALEATFVPELNLLGTSLRLSGEEFLALPGGIAAYRHRHTTGLPFLAPWANRLSGLTYRSGRVRVALEGIDLHTDEQGLPIHGTMSARQVWTVTELSSRGSIARLLASFDYDRPELLPAFPFPHRLEVEIALDGESLSVTTDLRPAERRSVPVSFGFHPYLRLPRASRSAWRLVLPRRAGIELDERGIPTGRRTELPAEAGAIGSRTLDDHFALGRERTFVLETSDRRVSVHYDQGYRYGQVFVPPRRRFVCLEPMTAPTNALVSRECAVVRPGETFRAQFRIRPERLR